MGEYCRKRDSAVSRGIYGWNDLLEATSIIRLLEGS